MTFPTTGELVKVNDTEQQVCRNRSGQWLGLNVVVHARVGGKIVSYSVVLCCGDTIQSKRLTDLVERTIGRRVGSV